MVTDPDRVNPEDHQMFAEEDGTITHVFTEGAEPTDIVRVDHIAGGATIGMMVVDGDAAVLLELSLFGETETAVVAIDPGLAKVIADGLRTAIERISE